MLVFRISGLNEGRCNLNIIENIRKQIAKMKEWKFHLCVFRYASSLSLFLLHIPSELQEILVMGYPGFGGLVS